MTPLRVKICGMRDPANIAEVAALRPDYVGLIFVPSSPRYVGSDFDSATLSPILSTTRRVGVFRDTPLETIADTVHRYNLDVAQLHGKEDSRFIAALRAALPPLTIFKAVSVENEKSLASLSAESRHPDAYLLDSGSGGTGTSFDWGWLKSYAVDVPFFLAGGIGLHNVDEVLSIRDQHPRLLGIDINSRAERVAGIKDTDTLLKIFQRLTP